MPPVVPAAGSYGTVHTADWYTRPDGVSVRRISGKITLVTADSFGVSPGARDSATWALKIEGERGSLFLLGCQVHGCEFHPEDDNINDALTFKVG